MIQPGDKVWIMKSDGADKAGWVVFDGKYFIAPCGTEYDSEDLASDIWDHHTWTDCWGENEGYRKEPDLMPNFLCMAEQLIATGEMP